VECEGAAVKNVQAGKKHYYRENKDGVRWGVKLRDVVENQTMWPTPRVGGQEGYKTRAKRKGHEIAMSYLESAVEYQEQTSGQLNPQREQVMWPTPSANEDAAGTVNGKMQNMLTHEAKKSQMVETEKGGQLNPTWVEWLMGFPLGWTDLNV
jgi:hypothetical protein